MAKETQKSNTNVNPVPRQGYVTAAIESSLHTMIAAEAKMNGLTFSMQVRDYMDKCIALEEKVDELRAEIKKITDVA